MMAIDHDGTGEQKRYEPQPTLVLVRLLILCQEECLQAVLRLSRNRRHFGFWRGGGYFLFVCLFYQKIAVSQMETGYDH